MERFVSEALKGPVGMTRGRNAVGVGTHIEQLSFHDVPCGHVPAHLGFGFTWPGQLHHWSRPTV